MKNKESEEYSQKYGKVSDTTKRQMEKKGKQTKRGKIRTFGDKTHLSKTRKRICG